MNYRFLKTRRGRMLMDVPRHFEMTHYKAVTADGKKFVYCPVGNICSWAEDDYDHEYCAWCKFFYRGGSVLSSSITKIMEQPQQ